MVGALAGIREIPSAGCDVLPPQGVPSQKGHGTAIVPDVGHVCVHGCGCFLLCLASGSDDRHSVAFGWIDRTGQFGHVFLVEDVSSGDKYALKRMTVQRDNHEAHALAKYELEIHVRSSTYTMSLRMHACASRFCKCVLL